MCTVVGSGLTQTRDRRSRFRVCDRVGTEYHALVSGGPIWVLIMPCPSELGCVLENTQQRSGSSSPSGSRWSAWGVRFPVVRASFPVR